MKGIVYHGSPTKGLKKLTPHRSTHLKNCIYATTNPAVALIFSIKNMGDLDFDLSNEDGKIIFTERRQDAFKIYESSGYLYTLDGTNFKHEEGFWAQEVISTQTEKVLSCEYIPNVLERLNGYAEKGEITIYRYPNRPDSIPKDDSDLVTKYIGFEEMGHKGAIDQLIFYFPYLKKQVFSKLDNPQELYYIDKKADHFDTITASDNIIDAICRSGSPVWIRDEGWVNYNIVDSKFIFEKGSFNLNEDFYTYKVTGTIERLSAHNFQVTNPKILGTEKIDLTKYTKKRKL